MEGSDTWLSRPQVLPKGFLCLMENGWWGEAHESVRAKGKGEEREILEELGLMKREFFIFKKYKWHWIRRVGVFVLGKAIPSHLPKCQYFSPTAALTPFQPTPPGKRLPSLSWAWEHSGLVSGFGATVSTLLAADTAHGSDGPQQR